MLSAIGKFILDYILSRLMAWAGALVAKYKRHEQVKDESGDSLDQLKKAKTGKEIDDASDSALGGF